MEIADPTTGLPSGHIVPVSPEIARMQGHPASPGDSSVLATLVHFKTATAGEVPAAELRNPAAGYGLRVSSNSPDNRALRVVAPPGGNYVSLGLQTNYDDPFGLEWAGEEGSGIKVLSPGQSFDWKIRLEIFPVARRNSQTSSSHLPPQV